MSEITKDKKQTNDAELLLSLLSQTGGLRALVDAGNTLFGNPVVIADTSWTVLAMTDSVVIPDDEGWNEFMNYGTLSADTVTLNIKNKLTERIRESKEPFFWQEPNMKYRRLIGKVFEGAHAIATVSVVEFSEPMDEKDKGRLSLFCRAVSAEMQKSRYQKFTRGLLYEDLISNILDGTITDKHVIDEKLRVFHLSYHNNLRVFAVNPELFDDRNLTITYLRDQIEKILSPCMALVWDSMIVVIKSYQNEAAELFETNLAELSNFLVKHDMHGGYSRKFSGLENLSTYLEQAISAIKIGKRMMKKPAVYGFDRLAVYRVADLCAEHSDLQNLSHGGIALLAEYDDMHGTNFYESLSEWFAHARNISDASDALHMHRNTLVYHLKRAEEIMGVDLTDSETLFHLELSLKFRHYARA